MSEIRNTEPKPIQDIISDVMADLINRSNINYYAPKVNRETAIAKPISKLDIECGDVVQIRAGAKSHIGEIGVIIGTRYTKLDNGSGAILYTVKFSDKDGADFMAHNLTLVRAGNGVI